MDKQFAVQKEDRNSWSGWQVKFKNDVVVSVRFNGIDANNVDLAIWQDGLGGWLTPKWLRKNTNRLENATTDDVARAMAWARKQK